MKETQKEKIEIKGRVKNIIFRNDQNGYTVFNINTQEENPEKITCIGHFAELNVSDIINITGNFITHPTYGTQLKVTSIKKNIELTEENITRYLSSGIIKGVGPKIAERIVKTFGLKTFEVIENNFRDLIIIKGITSSLAVLIHEKFIKLNKNRNIILFLQSLDMSPSDIIKTQNKYGDDVINMIKINPYRLIDEINGFGFKKADMIANKLGIEKTSPFRIQSAIKFCLQQACESHGNTYLPEEILIEKTLELIQTDCETIKNNIKLLQVNNIIRREILEEKLIIYISLYYHMEKFIAKKILELNKNFCEINLNLQDQIKKIMSNNKINLARDQLRAVYKSIISGVSIITGGPGTGKTTALRVIINILTNLGLFIELCAPTGRAAKRMSEATKHDAKTIHRMLGVNFSSKTNHIGFEFNENNPIRADYIIIDEASMIDISLMYNLLKAIQIGTKLIFVGDVDQLPSVGPGNILRDMIESNKIQTIRLTQIFRQAQESSIIINAHKINHGESLVLRKNIHDDFIFINKQDPKIIIKIILEMIINRIPNFLKITDLFEIQVLCPMKKSDLGTINLNRILQEKINPPCESKREKQFGIYIFREGDKVMQIKNNYSLEWHCYENNICVSNGRGIFNGDIGFIQNINTLDQIIKIKFDENKLVDYSFDQLDELDLAYAITIHKSQGSEYKAVIIPIFSGPPMLMNKNLLYTAVTRAKELVIIIGLSKMLYSMIKNKQKTERFSALSYRMQHDQDLFLLGT